MAVTVGTKCATARQRLLVIFVGDGWRTSRTKVLDNAVIGYCKIHKITPGRSQWGDPAN